MELFLLQQRYTLDLLKFTGNLGIKMFDAHLEMNHKLWLDDGEPLENIQRLLGKLISRHHMIGTFRRLLE